MRKLTIKHQPGMSLIQGKWDDLDVSVTVSDYRQLVAMPGGVSLHGSLRKKADPDFFQIVSMQDLEWSKPSGDDELDAELEKLYLTVI